MHPTANIALRAARLAGTVISRAYDRPDLLKVSAKGINDYVTNVDKEAETLILETLSKTYPEHAMLAEESGLLGNKDSEYRWIIDPLDGTLNFLRGIPHFCVSIACQHKGRLESAVILDPIRQEEFVASRGQGCYLNGHRLRVSETPSLQGAVVASGGPGSPDVAVQQTSLLQHLFQAGSVIRQAGSACLDLAYVASGRLDGVWLHQQQPWDMAAGVLMVTESGGLVSDYEGGGNFLKSGNIVAGTPKCFKTLLPCVSKEFAAAGG